MTPSISDIISENDQRLRRWSDTFDPVTGQGSTGTRVKTSIPGLAIPTQWLPKPMLDEPLIKALIKAKSVSAYIRHQGIEPDDDTIEAVNEAVMRLRCRHDFPFWAATFVTISKKGGGGDTLMRLTYPQRRLVEALDQQRLAGKPIRLILLKARQWGGSTTIQTYMAWLQLVHSIGLNSLIVAQVKDAALKIKEMFRRMLNAYPERLLYPQGLPPATPEAKLARIGGSDATQSVGYRKCTISVGTAEEPDSVRAGDYSLVHLSEVGVWRATDKKTPGDIVRAACSGVLYRPGTMIVYESTANGVGNFFHTEYTAAADPRTKSQMTALFVPWHDIELYHIPFASPQARRQFAQRLIDNRNRADTPSSREEPGRYLWWLWQKGATLEGINWYIEERAKYDDHGQMAAEYPSDDNEAFVNSGNRVFDKILVDRLRRSCRPPRLIGELSGSALTGPDSLQSLQFDTDSQGLLWIWSPPDIDPAEPVLDRYLVVVDIGGRSDKADYSVITVFDRLLMLDGEGPVIAAQWYGHTDMDILAWKAAQIATYYDNALLVIESNTIETHERDRRVDGDQSSTLLSELRDAYDNLYARRQNADDIRLGLPRRYGFHTNTATKPLVISTLVKCVRQALYTERDARALDEMINYERRQNGSFGAIAGQHDDLLMTRAIGLHICYNEMPLPSIPQPSAPTYSPTRPVTEATI